ncbi:MAG: hypothetical protein GY928_38970, partial [Colwellia sp.]|nr:hypothetical protein [Colwellia sp.]
MNCFNMSKVFSRATKWRSLDDKEYNLTSELKMVYGYRFTEYNKAKGSYKEPVSSVCYELAVSNKNVLACENMLYHMG